MGKGTIKELTMRVLEHMMTYQVSLPQQHSFEIKENGDIHFEYSSISMKYIIDFIAFCKKEKISFDITNERLIIFTYDLDNLFPEEFTEQMSEYRENKGTINEELTL